MAFTQTKPNRLLGELLQEEQEPFILEAYLFERGYLKNSSKSDPCCKKGAPYSSKLLKCLYRKLLLINRSLRIKNCDDKDGEEDVGRIPQMTRNNRPVMESHRFSSASNTSSAYTSCPEIDKDEEASISLLDQPHSSLPSDDYKSCSARKDEVPTDRKFRRLRHMIKDSKKHSSSVTEIQKTSHQKSHKTPSHPRTLKLKKVTEDSILSASLWELLVSSTTTEKPGCFQVAGLRELVLANSSSTQFKTKRMLQQNKQLLFDCAREIIENHKRREAQCGELLGYEEIGKLICQKIKEWVKQSSNETSVDQLLNLDLKGSLREWNDFTAQKREVATAIGDDILEELGREVVIDMVDSLGASQIC